MRASVAALPKLRSDHAAR